MPSVYRVTLEREQDGRFGSYPLPLFSVLF